MLTSPSANIAGSQTTRFIDLSFSKPRRDFCAGPRGNRAARSRLRSPVQWRTINDTVAFRSDFDAGNTSKSRKLAISISAAARKELIRTPNRERESAGAGLERWSAEQQTESFFGALCSNVERPTNVVGRRAGAGERAGARRSSPTSLSPLVRHDNRPSGFGTLIGTFGFRTSRTVPFRLIWFGRAGRGPLNQLKTQRSQRFGV